MPFAQPPPLALATPSAYPPRFVSFSTPRNLQPRAHVLGEATPADSVADSRTDSEGESAILGNRFDSRESPQSPDCAVRADS